MKRRRWLYLAIALVALVIGAWLTSGGEPPEPTKWPKVHMPRHATEEDVERSKSRIGVKPLPQQPPPVPPPPDAPKPRPTDPVLAALPPKVDEVAMVVEANALRNSDLGDAMVACLTSGNGGEGLARIRDAGFDPLTQLDRVSIFDETVMFSGDFHAVDFGTPDEHYGDGAIYARKPRDDGEESDVVAVWRGQATLIGPREDVQAAIDRLEGRVAPDEQPVLPQSTAYGEMYGTLKPEAFTKMLDESDPKLGEFLKKAAQSIDVHVDAMHDVGVVADVKGMEPAQVDELRRMIGGAIAAARARAAAQGQKEAADVLDLSRVLAPKPGASSFTMELGLPYDMMKAQLERCAQEGKRRREERATSAGDAGR